MGSTSPAGAWSAVGVACFFLPCQAQARPGLCCEEALPPHRQVLQASSPGGAEERVPNAVATGVRVVDRPLVEAAAQHLLALAHAILVLAQELREVAWRGRRRLL